VVSPGSFIGLPNSVCGFSAKNKELFRPIHDRMPVIVAPADYDRWLDPTVQKPELVQPLLRPYRAEEMETYPVSPWVNSPRNNGPKCVEPLASTG
jgi:putative SOS response-associated peptidase YedK